MTVVPVGDKDRLIAPVDAGGRLVQAVSDGGQVRLATTGPGGWKVHTTAGPTGKVTAATSIGDTLYLLAGPDENTQTLWQVDLRSIS